MKDNYIRIRCSEGEKALIKSGAANNNLSMSQYILTLVVKDTARPRNTLNDLTVDQFLTIMNDINSKCDAESNSFIVENGEIKTIK